MSNFDAAAGLTVGETNKLLSDFYSTVPADKSPFKGTETKTLDVIGKVVLTWDMTVVPVLAFGPPSQAVWDAALDTKGKTNKEAGNPIPTLPMVQVKIPALTASVKIGDAAPIGGDAKDVVVYATLTFAGADITITLVGLTIDESGFSKWDKVIFNDVLLPRIFTSAQAMISVVHVPTLSWHGVTLNTPVFMLTDSQLIAAATLSTNSAAVDVTGVTWPTDSVFILASKDLMNAALNAGLDQLVTEANANKSEFGLEGSGEKAKLADYDYTSTLGGVTATVGKTDPVTLDASVQLNDVQAGGKLTPLGMGLAALACPLGAGILALSTI